MKNIFKLFSVVAVSCFMLAASCGGDDAVMYKITVKCDKNMGTVSGDGKYEEGSTATLTATPKEGYRFVNWSDGSTNNPYLITVTADAEYTANFEENSGVSVTMGSTSWNAVSINGQYVSTAFLIAAAPSQTANYPFAKLLVGNGPAVGTYNGDAVVNDDGTANEGTTYMQYFESEDRGMQLDGNTTGDWWAKDLTVNVTAFDATAATITLVADATMGDLYALTQGSSWANTPTQSMTMTATNVALTAVKSLKATGNTGKIARR